MRIFHLALASDWERAQAEGHYTTSTLGVSLAEAGFIHASRADQWRGVRDRFYAEVDEPLVLLEIETDRLSARVVDEPADDTQRETFPHVYGPIETAAVVRVVPIRRDQAFTELFLRELFRNVLLASLVLAGAVLGALGVEGALGDALGGWARLLGAALGTLAGGALATAWVRARAQRRP